MSNKFALSDIMNIHSITVSVIANVGENNGPKQPEITLVAQWHV